jgi:hypothetical protein
MPLDLPTPDEVAPNLTKPVKGTALLGSRQRRSDRVAAEQREMQAALKRDERKCRVPRCEHVSKKLPIDPCHMRGDHRGMGGNPTGDRTTRDRIFAGCRAHHGLYDADLLDAIPQTAAGANGLMDWYHRAKQSDPWEHFASEKRIGVSETRGR